NFWYIFHNWFGSTYMTYQKLETPRWMQLARDVKKKSVFTGEDTGNTLSEGRQIWFSDKIEINGTWYLRTEHDSTHNNNKGLLLDDLEEIPFNDMKTPRWMSLDKDTHKTIPNTGKKVDSALRKGRDIHFTTKITVNGKVY